MDLKVLPQLAKQLEQRSQLLQVEQRIEMKFNISIVEVPTGALHWYSTEDKE